MSTRRSVTLSAAVIAAIALMVACATKHPPEASNRAIAETEKLRVLDQCLAVRLKLQCFRALVIGWSSLYNAGYVRPDYYDAASEEYKRAMDRYHGRRHGTYITYWDGGNSLRPHFSADSKAPPFILDLTDEEFQQFITDPFRADGGGFQFAHDPHHAQSLFSSAGPDGIVDIELTPLDLSKPNWGLGDDLPLLVYDPTNGIYSRGDIIYPVDFLRVLDSTESRRKRGFGTNWEDVF